MKAFYILSTFVSVVLSSPVDVSPTATVIEPTEPIPIAPRPTQTINYGIINETEASATVDGILPPIVTIASPQATIIGLKGTLEESTVEQFPGIPFAQPPTGSLRLRPPQPITSPMGIFKATSNGNACPQFVFSTDSTNSIPQPQLAYLLNTPLFQKVIGESEDCLQLNVHRPQGVSKDAKLPVLFWIFGGGFEVGWNSMYNGAFWVKHSVEIGQPIIVVTVNYRVGGFGFLGGKEVKADGASNLGLLDQRLGLQWTADNIAAFGGDPDKVTIWGESAGAISVWDHMAMYDGNITYKGKPLFRGAIMNSGSIVPADPIDSVKPQAIFDTVVSAAGCNFAPDKLECLRSVPYKDLVTAMNKPPFLLSYSSLALSYLPRPDGVVLTASPDQLALNGKFAKIPHIIGDQEDEGTLFALFEDNITTTDQMVDYFSSKYFIRAPRSSLTELVNLYNDTSLDGSPFRTGTDNNWFYPQFKRLAAILGDLTFTITRRAWLILSRGLNPNVKTWTYLGSYDHGTPLLGTPHGGDLFQVFFGIKDNYASKAFHSYYISFVNHLDPNYGSGAFADWPEWTAAAPNMLQMFANTSSIIQDTFRQDTLNFILSNLPNFYI
ncbi:alpha/beta-hydrolase [Microthyrium microscopicum]|uniref:Carboxylic ester hydrolase n=1 Tax=Microthyrium microscopicum TaxID=703497 RepID=A0A6A6U5Q1_9PEZI|nr:alpha/beta-hydrolase [Microthyrium microscopicum]